MIGLPGETKEQLLETLHLAEVLPVDFPLISFFHAIPGTRNYDEAMQMGRLLGIEGNDSFARLRSFDYVPNSLDQAFLMKAYRKTYRRIYWHPRRVLHYMLQHTRSLDDVIKGLSSARQLLRISTPLTNL